MSIDVLVVGGGPAGSTAATMLARRGLSVTLLERERFPRAHIGESLLPASMPILEALGVRDQLEAEGFLKKWGATMVWGSTREPWSWHFRETNRQHPHAYQVWRPAFDHLLLKNAAAAGVNVREGCRVLDITFDGDRATGARFDDGSGHESTLTAGHVVDASGQTGLIVRALKLRKNDEHFRNLAVYGYFEGAERLPPPDETNIFIESFEHGWFWNIPLHTGWMSVGAVVDSKLGGEALARDGAQAFLAAQIAAAPATAKMLANARMVDGPHVLRDWSYVSERVVGPGWIVCGDAACFIDPLFSTGVHLALSSGIMAAAYVATALKDDTLATSAGPVYKDLYYQQYSHFRELAKLFYASNRTIDSYFWEVRRVLADDSLTPREAFVRATAGQSAKGYERVVLDRGELPSDFVRQIKELERRHAERAAESERLIATREILRRIPVLGDGVAVERRAVIGDGEFEWGDVVVSSARPEGIEVSPFIKGLLAVVDGQRTVADIVVALGRGTPDEALLSATLKAVQILYVDGAVAELRSAS